MPLIVAAPLYHKVYYWVELADCLQVEQTAHRCLRVSLFVVVFLVYVQLFDILYHIFERVFKLKANVSVPTGNQRS